MRRRVIEAAAQLTFARLAIRVLPFRLLTRVLARPVRDAQLEASACALVIADVRRAIQTAARRLPGTTPCFALAAAAQAMLRRRGVRSTLYYGAQSAGADRLHAHVWLSVGDEPVIGYDAAAGFVAVATLSGEGPWIPLSGRNV